MADEQDYFVRSSVASWRRRAKAATTSKTTVRAA